MKTVSANKKLPLPMQVFEISDVVLKDKEKGTMNVCNCRQITQVQGLIEGNTRVYSMTVASMHDALLCQ